MKADDIRFLDGLADRLAKALYYGKLDAIGNGSVSTGLRHDDYDRLRTMTEAAKLAEWDRLNPHVESASA